MIHLGDITKLSGYEVPPVDCVIGGSPCQDLSIAGKRAGIAGQRSGLFAEQIRIVKEMRDADRLRGRTGQFIRPRYMVWENVPGAFSSNKGEDFRAVLEETIRIGSPEAPDIPLPSKGWPLADAYYGDGWSIAYRVLDSQFWGVPQRRRRIALVADFGGQSAPEILFERNGLSWDTPEGTEAGEDIAEGAGRGADSTDTAGGVRCLNSWDSKSERVYSDDGAMCSLTANGNGSKSREAVLCAGFKAGNGAKANGIGYELDIAPTLSVANSGINQAPAIICMVTQQGGAEIREDEKAPMLTASAGTSGNNQPVIYENHGQDSRIRGPLEVSPTVSQKWGTGGNNTPLVMTTGQGNAEIAVDKSTTLNCNHEAPIVAAVDCRNGVENGKVNGTLQAKSTGRSSLNLNNVVREAGMVRRLTPVECERLQGFPDNWTDIGDWTDSKGKVHKTSDTARYKALGNSIALPPWKWVLKRLCALYERDATMASLFDGIGGFPLIWERLNGPGTCLWASEIEEFPMAVTRKRFGGTE